MLEVCLEVDLGLPVPTTVRITSYQTNEQDSALGKSSFKKKTDFWTTFVVGIILDNCLCFFSATLDFEPSVQTVEFPRSLAGTTICINHTTIADDQLAAEGLEWFSLSLEVTSETLFGEREFEVVIPVSETKVTILDNDGEI